MLFTINSKVFGEDLVQNERDITVLQCQYCIVSTRIRLRERNLDNVANLQNILFPNMEVLTSNDDDFDMTYHKQLEMNKSFIARLILISEKNNMNIVFICTKSEEKLGILVAIRGFIRKEFGIPVYDYQYYTSCDKLETYDKQRVIKKCKKIIEEHENEHRSTLLKTSHGREQLVDELETMSKKELRKECKRYDIPINNDMSRKEMIDLLSALI